MNLTEKKAALISLISEYLKKRIPLENLQEFSWEIITYFNKNDKSHLPPDENFEKEFWYTIWQIQHLADEEHESKEVTQKTLIEALEYLKGIKKIPKNFIGLRP